MGVIDYGECPELVHFMFMPLCGQSLESILKDRMPTFETALILSEQTLRAVQNFHTFMHIHRDLKPANFVFGQVPWHNKIFLIDFGMAVRFCVDPKKMPKTSVYDFIGTLRYAPRNMHKGMPQGRKDDLESWLYVVFELYKREILPWSHERDTKRVEFQKERMFIEMPESIFGELPSCFMKIAREINKLSIFEQPKYDSIHAAFYKLANEMKVRFNDPLEFVGWGKKQASLIQIVNPVPFAPPTLSLVEAKTIYATRTMEGVEETSRRVSKPAKSITVVKEAFGGQANKKENKHLPNFLLYQRARAFGAVRAWLLVGPSI
ncbi:Protein kinase domain-containing protein [Aphelenchoides bicaudatus]|nr:Protein kinase domain-containing protein [Aphelenchoides bicaudatus]